MRRNPIHIITAAFFMGCMLAFFVPGIYASKAETGPGKKDVRKPEYIDANELILKAERKYERDIKDYKVFFYRQENLKATRTKGENKKLGDEEKILLRIREVPFSVYMEWVGKVHKGRKVIYVQGWNKNRMKIKLDGLAGILLPPIDLSPNSILIRDHSRHPITNAGIGNLIKSLVSQFELAKKNGDLDIEFVKIEKVGKRDAYVFERILPDKTFPDGEKYYCHKLTLHLDTKTNFPLKVETRNWKNVVMERFRYEDFTFNNNFTDKDFSPKANGY